VVRFTHIIIKCIIPLYKPEVPNQDGKVPQTWIKGAVKLFITQSNLVRYYFLKKMILHKIYYKQKIIILL
jgi:hypothetical protein